MRRIKKLSKKIINQIAAGEIIERPSSIVKELFENSVDSFADCIDIKIYQGGISKIIVTDNGNGIHKDDLQKITRRHHTSKIYTKKELENILSLGFRGEALASIASVSYFSLISRQDNNNYAWKISTIGNNKNKIIIPAAHNIGTTVEVCSLFFNMPVRKKLLKEYNEFLHISKMVKKLILSHFNINCRFFHNNKIIYDIKASNTETEKSNRIKSLFNENFISNMLKINYQIKNLKLWGWIGLPTFSQISKDQQYFYVNRRIMKNKIINSIIRIAYRGLIYRNQNPVFILFLEINENLLNINISPKKNEVHFQEKEKIQDFILKSLEKSLKKTNPKESLKNQYISNIDLHTLKKKIVISNFLKNNFKENYSLNSLNKNKNLDIYHFPPLGYAIGQFYGTYILSQNQKNLIIVDIHAAHERIFLEKIKKLWKLNSIESQLLLIPIILSVSDKEFQYIKKFNSKLNKIGIGLDLTNNNIVSVKKIPTFLKTKNIYFCIQDIIKDIIQYGNIVENDFFFQKILSTISCYSAIKSNQKLSISEMNRLLRDMENSEKSNQCNHGRPTWIMISAKYINKIFLRNF